MIKQIAETIRGVRKELGLTQKQISEKVGINQFTYANYEIARTMPPTDTYLRILGLRDDGAAETDLRA